MQSESSESVSDSVAAVSDSVAALAPMVSAVLRDCKVMELMDEVKQKDMVINQIMHVEITGPNGTPVYAEGQFNRGKYGGRVDQWFPSLQHKKDCPLSQIRGLEVRLGGMVQFSLDPFRDQEVFIKIDNETAQHQYYGGKDMLIEPDDGTELYCVLYGWQEEHWRPLLQPGAWDERAEAALENIERMPKSKCFARFECLSFNVEKYRSLIRNVKLANKDVRNREHQLQRHAFAVVVHERLAAAGLADQYSAISFLMSFHLNITAVNKEFEQVLTPIIRIYQIRQQNPAGDDFASELHRELTSFVENGQISEAKDRKQSIAKFVVHVKRLIEAERNDPDASYS
ncbi:expressed unknown protein [Seminavis robusta]|uniref:Uncharacterized protein n=1 Tax=Seminavis robusta TaxID=568900 RepID=A0A9N8DDC0_9STRA|nr:expressed unknown protein [Seminavis robusta]|eukprot:Sro22_g015280.1 n/a (342) ;mRNA; f:58089-59114